MNDVLEKMYEHRKEFLNYIQENPPLDEHGRTYDRGVRGGMADMIAIVEDYYDKNND